MIEPGTKSQPPRHTHPASPKPQARRITFCPKAVAAPEKLEMNIAADVTGLIGKHAALQLKVRKCGTVALGVPVSSALQLAVVHYNLLYNKSAHAYHLPASLPCR